MSDLDFPPKFTVEPASILKLLTGDTFYSSADAAIREAVLNAIDAIARASDQIEPFDPIIEVLFDRASCTVTISDNGVGMTKEEISAFFTKVGASAARIYEADKSHRHRMIGEFGIGVMSYFLVGDEFAVHSQSMSIESISLKFSNKMLDAETRAEVLAPVRSSRGTTLVLNVRDAAGLELLIAKFPHWIRNVRGLTARLVNEDCVLEQGGLSHEIQPVAVDTPDWVMEANLGPPTNLDSWHVFDGRAHVDVLYSGVFVEGLDVDRLWGIEGSIHVDPKRFRPKLNREGFVGTSLRSELEPFLQKVHPKALAKASGLLGKMLEDSPSGPWTNQRLATLWLAVPRSGEYAEAAALWDEEFRQKRVLRQLLPDNKDQMVSVADLQASGRDKIFLASLHLGNEPELLRHAVRILREQGEIVVQGLEREGGYLNFANLSFGSTEAILINRFASELPQLVPISSVANSVLLKESLADVMTDPVAIKLISLGAEGSPLIVAGPEIWINSQSEAGRGIVTYVCENPYGLQSLIAACLTYAPGQIQAVANLFRGKGNSVFFVGPVRRQYLKRELK